MFLPCYISLNWFSYFLFIAVLFHCSTFSLYLTNQKPKVKLKTISYNLVFFCENWWHCKLQSELKFEINHTFWTKKKFFFPFWIIKTLILIILNNKVQKEGRPKGAKTCWDIVRNSTVQCQSVKIPPPPQKTNKKLWKFTRL